MAEELVLPAKVTDGFTKPLKDLADKLRNLRPSPALQATQRHFVELRNQITQATKAIAAAGTGLTTGMGLPGLSLGALSAAGAIAALSANVKSFATSTIDMKNFAAATGITVAKLKELQAVSPGLGLDPEAMKRAVEFSSQNADQMRRHQGNFAALSALGPGGRSIANDIANSKSNDEVLEKSLRYIQSQKTAAQRRTAAGLLLGDEGMAAVGNVSPAELASSRSAARASIAKQSKDDEAKAKAFLDSTERVNAALDSIKLKMGSALAPALTAVADAVNKFSKENADGIEHFFTDIGKAITDYDWQGGAKAFIQALEDIRDFVDRLNGTGKYAPGGEGSSWLSEDQAKPGQVYKDRDGNIRRKEGGTDSTPPAPAKPAPATRDDYSPISYTPGQRAGLAGIQSVSRSASVALLAEGVSAGMQDFYRSLQGGTGDGAGGGGFGGGGFQNASYTPPPTARSVRMGGGGQGGSADVSNTVADTKVGKGEIADYVRESALRYGIDPNIALRVVSGEGGFKNPYQRSLAPAPRSQRREFGSRENSYGPFQLYISGTGSGMGDQALKAGIDPRKDWKKAVDFALSQARKSGWGQWYGAAAKGVRGRMGIGPLPSPAERQSLLKKRAAMDAKPNNGKVQVEVLSKDHPVKITDNKGPALQSVTLKRGKAQGLQEM